MSFCDLATNGSGFAGVLDGFLSFLGASPLLLLMMID